MIIEIREPSHFLPLLPSPSLPQIPSMPMLATISSTNPSAASSTTHRALSTPLNASPRFHRFASPLGWRPLTHYDHLWALQTLHRRRGSPPLPGPSCSRGNEIATARRSSSSPHDMKKKKKTQQCPICSPDQTTSWASPPMSGDRRCRACHL